MDYKRSQGMRYSTSFRLKEESVWDAGMVLRILKNPVYIGVLEQGRVTVYEGFERDDQLIRFHVAVQTVIVVVDCDKTHTKEGK